MNYLLFLVQSWRTVVRGDYLALFLILVGKLSYLPLSIKYTVGLLHISVLKLKFFLFIFSLLKVFMNEYWILPNGSLHWLVDHVIFLFILLMWWITLMYFWMSNQLCMSVMNPTWLWIKIHYILGWVWFANILLPTFAFVLMRDIGLQVFFPVTSLCLVLQWCCHHRMYINVLSVTLFWRFQKSGFLCAMPWHFHASN